MLPNSFHLPAAAVLIAAGLLACFFGHRLFRLVLGIFGFILGALWASSLVAPSNEVGTVVAALVGGALGSLILAAGYFVGVLIVGAGLGVFAAQLIWTQIGGDPHPLIVILCAVVGSLAAWWFQRLAIILGTSFGGAWTAVVGTVALLGEPVSRRPQGSDVWILYPANPSPGRPWVLAAWVILALIGTVAQFNQRARKKKR
jgi:hypothetical protein